MTRTPPRSSCARSGSTRRCACGTCRRNRPRSRRGLSGQEAYRFIAAAPFEAYAARHGKRRWGDKTPHYVHHVDHLLRLWPHARFVVLVRDGRDVALSLRRMPFGPNNAWAAAQWWARGIRAGARAQREHPGAVLTVRYEDLAQRPREEVRRLCTFLGLDYADDMLALEHVDPRADRARPGRLVPDAVQRHQHERGRPLAARDERARPAHLRRAGGRGARAARLRHRRRRRCRACRRGRRAGSTTTTS